MSRTRSCRRNTLFYAFLALAGLFLGLAVQGCSGHSGSYQVPVRNAELQINFDLAELAAREVPGEVQSFRISGYDQNGHHIYGPADMPRQPQVILNDVPVQVESVRIEYLLEGGTLSGLYAQAVDLQPGQPYPIDDPDFEDVGDPASLQQIALDPPTATVPAQETKQFQAYAVFTEGFRQSVTSDAVWSVGDTGIAEPTGSKGLVKGLKHGTTTVMATYAGRAGQADLTVTPGELVSLEVTPPTATVTIGAVQNFVATGRYVDQSTADLTDKVTWSSSNTEVATIQNAQARSAVPAEGPTGGLATGVGVGEVTITATHPGTNKTDTATLTVNDSPLVKIEVTPGDSQLPKGRTLQFTATATYENNTTRDVTAQVEWSSSSIETLSFSDLVGSRGVAKGHAVGQVTVTATDAASGVQGQTGVEVTPAELVSLQVTPTNPTVPKGLTRQFTAMGLFSDDTTQDLTGVVTWSSTATSFAAVDAAGLATAKAVGETTIEALDPGTQIKGSTTLTVSPAELASIAVTPSSPTIVSEETQQFVATGTYSDATEQDLTQQVAWSSSNHDVATITSAVVGREAVANVETMGGLATAGIAGETTITAAFPGKPIQGSTKLTVVDATLVSIEVTPAEGSVAKGRTRQFTATGTFDNGKTGDLTTRVNWTTSGDGHASISNAQGSQGLAKGESVGQSTITATYPDSAISDTATLNVTKAELVSIAVTPANASVVQNATRQFIATGTFSDDTQQVLTDTVTWKTQPEPSEFATISNAAGSKGLATGVAPGQLTIVALDVATNISGSTGLTVTEPPPVVITVRFREKCAANTAFSPSEVPPSVVGLTVFTTDVTKQPWTQGPTATLDAQGTATFTAAQITPGRKWMFVLDEANGCNNPTPRTGCWDGTHTGWKVGQVSPDQVGEVHLFIASRNCGGTPPSPPYSDAAWGNCP